MTSPPDESVDLPGCDELMFRLDGMLMDYSAALRLLTRERGMKRIDAHNHLFLLTCKLKPQPEQPTAEPPP